MHGAGQYAWARMWPQAQRGVLLRCLSQAEVGCGKRALSMAMTLGLYAVPCHGVQA